MVIDVRNHYEAIIGHFQPPAVDDDEENDDDKKKKKKKKKEKEKSSAASSKAKKAASNGEDADSSNPNATGEPPKYLDPLMRKSTEFPVWLDRPETKEQLKGKQVLMFCTGGIR